MSTCKEERLQERSLFSVSQPPRTIEEQLTVPSSKRSQQLGRKRFMANAVKQKGGLEPRGFCYNCHGAIS